MSGLTPVSVERIRSMLSRNEVNFGEYGKSELAVPTTNAIYFWNTSNPQILQLRGQWRGIARTDAEFAGLAEEVSHCNTTRTGPKAFLAPFEDGSRYGLIAECNIVAISGLTERQLVSFFETSMSMIMGFLHDVETSLPDLVTWNEEDRP